MQGAETSLIKFMEGDDNRYVIPVYQRKYSWELDNCRQLYSDLKKIFRYGRQSHFFGSVVSAVVPSRGKMLYHVIDGQQRLTTVTLLLLAVRNLLRKGRISSEKRELHEEINGRFLISRWAEPDDQIKLRPVKGDQEALKKLFGDEEDYDQASRLTANYRFFCEQLLSGELSPDEIFDAVKRLEIISITLDQGDNAQLIFESLNSTGLALTEGDKIRNYVLMGQEPDDQRRLYEDYWTVIEGCTGGDISDIKRGGDNLSPFVRDYLSIKLQKTPNEKDVYQTFKSYAESQGLPMERLLEDLKRYSRLYQKLTRGCSGTGDRALDGCLYRMKYLDMTVTRPFFLEVLRLHQEGALDVGEVSQIFQIVEAYLFRRNVCGVPTNSLNKIFLTLHKDILRYDGSCKDYLQKFIYALLSNRGNGRFPDDKEFAEALETREIYRDMRGRYRNYLFERFENWGTLETKDVYSHLEAQDYSIEHIMPQKLTPAWRAALGPEAEEVHGTWLHRLANLTLSGYNASLSNSSFAEKRDAPKGGYRASGLRMNQKIAAKESWGLPELEERCREMVDQAKEIWSYPQTSFVPAKRERELEFCSLDDESEDLTSRNIEKYSYQNYQQSVGSWAEMLIQVVELLHQQDKSVLYGLVKGDNVEGLSQYISATEKDLRTPKRIDDGIYLTTNSSTGAKMVLLRRLFALYGADPADLVFYFQAQQQRGENDIAEAKARKDAMAVLLQEWAKHQEGVRINSTSTRLSTDNISKILLDYSGDSHDGTVDRRCSYEILNNGTTVYFRFVLGSEGGSDRFLALCDSIQKHYPYRIDNPDWKWRTHFRSTAISVGNGLAREEIFAKLDQCLAEIKAFESELMQKLQE